jgi:probable addiction module antidote protein
LDDWNRYEALEDEESFAGYLLEAHLNEDAAGVVDALADVAVARLINQIAGTAGIDRTHLCAVFAGHSAPDDATISKALEFFAVPVSSDMPVAVGQSR